MQTGVVNHNHYLAIGMIIILAVIGLVTAILALADGARNSNAELRYRCRTVQRHIMPGPDELALTARCEQLQHRGW